MQTKFDIGETVYIKAEVLRIHIQENNVEYLLRFVDCNETGCRCWMKEEDLTNEVQSVSVDESESEKAE